MEAKDPIRLAAADALQAATGAPRVLVGFDGFLDSITSAVETRRSMAPDDYAPMRTIDTLASRVAGGGGGRSVNIELREREVRAGGNGPLLAGALSGLDVETTLIGALGKDSAGDIHPAYQPLIARCFEAISIAPSARTDALEFTDGKVMFNWSAPLDPIDWEHLKDRVGLDRLTEMCARSDVIATINWTNLGGLPSIWRGLRDEILPSLTNAPTIFVDLSDPAKRTDGDVRAMLDDLRSLNAVAPLTLGLNIAEAQRLSSISVEETLPDSCAPDAMRNTAERLRTHLGLTALLIHTRGIVAGADAQHAAAVPTRVTAQPVISTGAGDHFNGGYVASRALGLSLEQSLACACDTASAYVATGGTPSRDQLIGMLRTDMPSRA